MRATCRKHGGKALHIDIAWRGDQQVGYVISGIRDTGTGEIESIYVAGGYQGQAIGEALMHRALAWLEAKQVHTKIVDVAVGNERAYKFYARFGFYHRVTRLKQKRP